jgi:hypothetical protein
MKKQIIIYATLLGLFLALLIGLGVYNDTRIETIYNSKVIELQQQQLISGDKDGMTTEIRYLVITDKETFVCESSIINGKYDNSNIFWKLKKDSTYTFKVCGLGKGALFNYRNILEAK